MSWGEEPDWLELSLKRGQLLVAETTKGLRMIETHGHGSYLGVRRVELRRYKINFKLSEREREISI